MIRTQQSTKLFLAWLFVIGQIFCYPANGKTWSQLVCMQITLSFMGNAFLKITSTTGGSEWETIVKDGRYWTSTPMPRFVIEKIEILRGGYTKAHIATKIKVKGTPPIYINFIKSRDQLQPGFSLPWGKSPSTRCMNGGRVSLGFVGGILWLDSWNHDAFRHVSKGISYS